MPAGHYPAQFPVTMNYSETLQYLYRSTPVFEHVGASAYKPGLGNMLVLDAWCGHPHRQYKIIHVAGTNGKGSVSHSLAAILQQKGLKVGLYTSPHLVDFAERIRVNGQPIAHDYVIQFVEQYTEAALAAPEAEGMEKHLAPSFFELTTAMAFSYFAQQKVDVAVVEVGLGGRLDSTNIVSPMLSVITNISLDHTNLLGSTLRQIAAEKAGIVKRGVPAVVGETTPETKAVFLAKAHEEQAPIVFAEEQELSDLEALTADFQLKGNYQSKNLRTILCAVSQLPEQLQPSAAELRQALAHVCDLTGLQGRWQELFLEQKESTDKYPKIFIRSSSDNEAARRVVCDTGHNAAAWEYLAPQLTTLAHHPSARLHMVFGMVDDKDLTTVLRLIGQHLSPNDSSQKQSGATAETLFYWTQAATHRAIAVEELQRQAAALGLQGEAYQSVRAAFSAALAAASPQDVIFVGGSSYVVADFLTAISTPPTQQ